MSSWRQYIGYHNRMFLRNRRIKRLMRAGVNSLRSLWYEVIHVKIPLLGHQSSMKNFVYPTHGAMRRMLRHEGFEPIEGPFQMIGHETIYVATRKQP